MSLGSRSAFSAPSIDRLLADAVPLGHGCHRIAIPLPDNRHHLLFRKTSFPHCSLRIGSQSLNLSMVRKSGGRSSLPSVTRAANVVGQFCKPILARARTMPIARTIRPPDALCSALNTCSIRVVSGSWRGSLAVAPKTAGGCVDCVGESGSSYWSQESGQVRPITAHQCRCCPCPIAHPGQAAADGAGHAHAREPIALIPCEKETCRSLLNKLVGKREQIWGEREAKLSCSLLVDNQLKSCGLHNRNIGGFGAL